MDGQGQTVQEHVSSWEIDHFCCSARMFHLSDVSLWNVLFWRDSGSSTWFTAENPQRDKDQLSWKHFPVQLTFPGHGTATMSNKSSNSPSIFSLNQTDTILESLLRGKNDHINMNPKVKMQPKIPVINTLLRPVLLKPVQTVVYKYGQTSSDWFLDRVGTVNWDSHHWRPPASCCWTV